MTGARSSAPVTAAVLAAAATVSALFVSALTRHGFRDLAPYNLGEFLISYRAGFVRRGLIGELLFHVPLSVDQARLELVLKASCALVYLAAFFWLLTPVFRQTRSVTVSLLLMFQPFLFAFPVLEFQWLRKDGLLLLAFYASLALLKRPTASRLVMANLLSIAAILSHELFGFSLLPLLIVIAAATPARSAEPITRRLGIALLQFSPAIAALALSLARHGDDAVARVIIESWRLRGIVLYDVAVPEYHNAIQALGQSTAEALGTLSMLLDVVRRGNVLPMLYWILVIPFAATAVSVLAMYRDGTGQQPCTRSTCLANPIFREAADCVLLAGVCCAPLFIVGQDFGRWMFLWLAASAVVFSEWRAALISTARESVPQGVQVLADRFRTVVCGPFVALFCNGHAWAPPLGVLTAAMWLVPVPHSLISRTMRELFQVSLLWRVGSALGWRW